METSLSVSFCIAQEEICLLLRALSTWLSVGEKNTPGACNNFDIGKMAIKYEYEKNMH